MSQEQPEEGGLWGWLGSLSTVVWVENDARDPPIRKVDQAPQTLVKRAGLGAGVSAGGSKT